ncbi:hypothetical protein MRB53_009460 [Persea americana]|uniref:Uncharacterized protein n=1 Tax=Persea americana TaxID=3435 RepID=A0ACC2LPS0_PERAE|nr:hypothetical protein MRB53_009460 [Persea americana]
MGTNQVLCNKDEENFTIILLLQETGTLIILSDVIPQPPFPCSLTVVAHFRIRASNHFAWPTDSPFLRPNPESLDHFMLGIIQELSVCGYKRAPGSCEQGLLGSMAGISTRDMSPLPGIVGAVENGGKARRI